MLKFYQQRSWKYLLWSPLMAITLAVVAMALGFVVYERYQIERDMAARRADLEIDFKRLEERRRLLSEQVDYLSHERGIEAEMRRNFDVAHEGEKVVIIINEDIPTIEPLSPISAPPAKTRPWYRFWE